MANVIMPFVSASSFLLLTLKRLSGFYDKIRTKIPRLSLRILVTNAPDECKVHERCPLIKYGREVVGAFNSVIDGVANCSGGSAMERQINHCSIVAIVPTGQGRMQYE